MVSRVRPIDVSVSFDDRTYKLGEAIDLTIEMSPNRECQVREGRAGLMLEERWTERSTLSYEKPIFGQGSVRGGAPRQIGTETVTKDVSKDHKETSVHSSVVFLENVQVQPGSPARHAVRLQIQREAPPHAGKPESTEGHRWTA